MSKRKPGGNMTEEQQNPIVDQVQALKERRIAFGLILREARERAQCSTSELAQSTKISKEFIELLEVGQYEKLPGQIFVRGFIRSISRAIGADPKPMVEAFDASWAVAEERPAKIQIPHAGRSVDAGLRKKARTSLPSGMPFTLRMLLRRLDPRVVAVVAMVSLGVLGFVAYSLQSHSGVSRSRLETTRQPANTKAEVPSISGAKTAETAQGQSSVINGENKVTAAVPATAAAGQVQEISGNIGEESLPESAKSDLAKEPVTSNATAKTSVSANSGVAPKGTADRPAEAPPTAVRGTQQLELVVREAVKVRLKLDRGEQSTVELQPNTYKYTFKDRADIMIYDAGSAEMSFNGKSLGSLGSKGRIRKLSFRAVEGDKNPL